jgi:hypothetical protein
MNARETAEFIIDTQTSTVRYKLRGRQQMVPLRSSGQTTKQWLTMVARFSAVKNRLKAEAALKKAYTAAEKGFDESSISVVSKNLAAGFKLCGFGSLPKH